MPDGHRPHDVRNLLISAGDAQNLRPVSMCDLGWTERGDLQRWVRDHPGVIEPDLLLISEEFAGWEGAGGPVLDRLDLLFLDRAGRPVVVELKRGSAPDRTESQAFALRRVLRPAQHERANRGVRQDPPEDGRRGACRNRPHAPSSQTTSQEG